MAHIVQVNLWQACLPGQPLEPAGDRVRTHELIEASDLTVIAERARGITYQPPGT
jgi:hypothetical protein